MSLLLFGQRDPRWSNHVLGWGPALGTIGQFGCLDTVLAMIAWDSFGDTHYTPATIDEVFTTRKIFVREPTGTFDLLPDNALSLVWPNRFVTSAYAGFRGDLIAQAVPSPDTYAYVYISTASVPTHFVLMYSADSKYIADPWTGKIGTLTGYGGPAAVHKTVIVKKLTTPKPVPTPPAPTPIPPAPAPVPTPPPADVLPGLVETIILTVVKLILILFGKTK